MLIIGERINGMFRDIARAIKDRDPAPVQEWARKQEEAGAHYLDINVGPVRRSGRSHEMAGGSYSGSFGFAFGLDSTKYDAIEESLKICKRPAMINSVPAEAPKMERVFTMAAEHNSEVICLAMNEEESPRMQKAALLWRWNW